MSANSLDESTADSATSGTSDQPRSLPEGRPTHSLAELTRRNVQAIARLEHAAASHRHVDDRVADAVTRFVGSMPFVYVHLAWFGGWVLLNSVPYFRAWRVDPFPYTFLTFIVSLEAIFLSTFILISQNHEEQLAQRRSHLDLQINLLSEQENSKLLRMVESIQRRLKIEVDEDTKQLEEATEPEQLSEEIDEAIEPSPSSRT